MKDFYCSTCFECYHIHPQELAAVCGCTALFRCGLVYWCGSAGVGWYPSAGWSTSAPTCTRIPPYTSRTAPIHQYISKQSRTPTYSRQLLRMNVKAFETWWAIKKSFIKWHQVGSIYSTSKMMHGPINIRWATDLVNTPLIRCTSASNCTLK
jgi:hypothetical protein